MSLPQLRRIRWAVRTALILGVAASVAANVLHAEPNIISRVIAAWPPLALLLTVELVAKVPVHRRHLATLRVLSTAVIGGIAAWVSYWHMAAVAHRYGESATSSYLLPVSVDGLVIVACVSLVELAGRIRAATLGATWHLPEQAEPGTPVGTPTEPRQRANPSASKVARAHAKHPDVTHAELARKTGLSLRTVKRYRPARHDDLTPSPNGGEPR